MQHGHLPQALISPIAGMHAMKKPRHLLAAAVLLAASTAASAVPFAITYEGEVANSSIPGIANQSYSLTFIFDNGGSSAASQTWQPAHLTCAIWRMNTARDALYLQDLTVAPPNYNSGATTTGPSGALTGLFTVAMDSPAAQPGQYLYAGALFNGAVKWFADNGSGGDAVLIDGIGTATPHSFDDPSPPYGGVQMTPARWSNPQRVMGACDDTPYAPALFATTAPQPHGGFAGFGATVTSWTQAATATDVTITAPLADLRPGGPYAGVQGTVYLTTQTGPGTTAAHNAAPPVMISGLGESFTPTTLWSGLTLPPGTYHLIFTAAQYDPPALTSLSPAASFNVFPTYTTAPGVAPLPGVPQLLSASQINTAFPPASPFVPAENGQTSNLIVSVTGTLAAPAASQVPALHGSALALLGTLIAMLAFWRARRGV